MSGAMALTGYMRDFYRGISVVNLQYGCSVSSRKTVDIRLDAKKEIFDKPFAEFNRVKLPEGFLQRIRDKQKDQSDRNAVFIGAYFRHP